MAQGFSFLLAVASEGVAAAALGCWLAAKLGLSRGSGGLRCLAAAIIGTGVTQPVVWLEFSRFVDLTGSRWGGLAMVLGLMILIETPFFAAALRGHWRLSLLISMAANVASGALGMMGAWSPARAAVG